MLQTGPETCHTPKDVVPVPEPFPLPFLLLLFGVQSAIAFSLNFIFNEAAFLLLWSEKFDIKLIVCDWIFAYVTNDESFTLGN